MLHQVQILAEKMKCTQTKANCEINQTKLQNSIKMFYCLCPVNSCFESNGKYQFIATRRQLMAYEIRSVTFQFGCQEFDFSLIKSIKKNTFSHR